MRQCSRTSGFRPCIWYLREKPWPLQQYGVPGRLRAPIRGPWTAYRCKEAEKSVRGSHIRTRGRAYCIDIASADVFGVAARADTGPMDNLGERPASISGSRTGSGGQERELKGKGLRFSSHHRNLCRNAKQAGTHPGLFELRGGDDGIRTHDPHVANVMLSQLSYIPTYDALSRKKVFCGYRPVLSTQTETPI